MAEGHQWRAVIRLRHGAHKTGCPYCSGLRVSKTQLAGRSLPTGGAPMAYDEERAADPSRRHLGQHDMAPLEEPTAKTRCGSNPFDTERLVTLPFGTRLASANTTSDTRLRREWMSVFLRPPVSALATDLEPPVCSMRSRRRGPREAHRGTTTPRPRAPSLSSSPPPRLSCGRPRTPAPSPDSSSRACAGEGTRVDASPERRSATGSCPATPCP